MGNKQAGAASCKLKKAEVKALTDVTHFSADEIKALWFHFRSIATDPSELLMNKSDFQNAMTWRSPVLIDRMFALFDTDADGFINYNEFVKGLSILDSKASSLEKLQFSFNVYDSNRDGYINEDDIYDVTLATVREHDLAISDSDVRRLVRVTLEEANPARPGEISFPEYQRLLTRNPKMLSSLSMNISSMIAEYLDQVDVKSSRRNSQTDAPTNA